MVTELFRISGLIEIMNKHGLKGAFNINAGQYMPEGAERNSYKLKLSEAKELYLDSGQEVALHGFYHPLLEKLGTSEIIYEIMKDRKVLKSQYCKIVGGLAYPFGTYSDKVVDVLEKCDVAYARTIKSTFGFEFPENWLMLHPTCHHNYEKLEVRRGFGISLRT